MTVEKEVGNVPAKRLGEERLEKEVTRQCPECAGDITLEVGTIDGQIVNCSDCNFELEVVFFDPNDPDDVKRLIEIAQERGSREGESYDVSHLNLKESPALIPAPQEGEDWGE